MTELAKRDKVNEIVQTIDRPEFRRQLEEALPEGLSVEKFTRTTKLAIQLNPEIVEADRQSLFLAMVRCAKDGLLPDGREAALVKVKVKGRDTVAYWPMVGGFRKIAAQHGIVIAADVVRANDTFTWSKVPPSLDHRPAELGQDRGEPRGAYAVALYQADNRFVTSPVVMDVAEIEKVRAVSRASNSEYGPWVNWWDRMACKTVARRLFAELPLAQVDERTRSVMEASGEIEETTAAVPELAALPVEVDSEIGEPEVVEA